MNVPGYAKLEIHTENTFLEQHLKDIDVLPTLIISFRYDCEEQGYPDASEFFVEYIKIKNPENYSDYDHDLILDLADEFENKIKDLFLQELIEKWVEYYEINSYCERKLIGSGISLRWREIYNH